MKSYMVKHLQTMKPSESSDYALFLLITLHTYRVMFENKYTCQRDREFQENRTTTNAASLMVYL